MDRSKRNQHTRTAPVSAAHIDQSTLRRGKYPYASTPAVSPSPSMNGSVVQDHRANLKLPVGPLAPQEQFPGPGPQMVNHNHANVTMRDRYNYNSCDTTSGSISPIPPNESCYRNPLQFTEPRFNGAGRQLFLDDSRADSLFFPPTPREMDGPFGLYSAKPGSSSGSVAGGAANVFPFPTVSCPEELLEPGELLCNHLKVLTAMKKLENERARMMIPKRKEKAEDKFVPYEFTAETFYNVNSEASIHALYLIFTLLDPKEAEQRLRDCWPVYEKKMEGIFRRVALDWMKRIIAENPAFFRDLRVEALASLLVSSGGNRFIVTMCQFCRCVMYILADQKKASVKQQVLLPPAFTNNPEITNRQLHVLKTRTINLSESVLKIYKEVVASHVQVNQRLKWMDELTIRIAQIDEMYSSRVRSLVAQNPEIFGTPSEEEWERRDVELSELKMRRVIDDAYDDFVTSRLDAALQKQSEEIYKPVSFLQDIIEDYGKIWYILEMDKTNPVVLDCNKILPCQLQDASGERTLNHFVKLFCSAANNLLSSEYLNSPLSPEMLKSYQQLCLRINFLEMLKSKVDKLIPANISADIQHAKNKREMMKARLASYDWSQLSGIQESRQNKLWDMTPIRVFDINKPSGKTPGINNFLDLTSGSCEHQASIVKRRGASIIKQRRLPINQGESSCSNASLKNGAHSKTANEDETDSSDVTTTPVSVQMNDRLFAHQAHAHTPISSSSMRKSVSFGSSPIGNNSLNSSRISSIHRHSTSSARSSLTPSNRALTLSHVESADTSVSESDVPVGLDVSTQERVDRLLESIAPSNSSRRRSQSPPLEPEDDDGMDDHDNNTVHDVSLSSGTGSVSKPASPIKSVKEADAIDTELFEVISYIGDWELSKGIMDVSHSELIGNSDSDE